MERHERYDPEDIESLLSERTFDELLPDERAFVLRHLSDRDEYERMRALLHYVRPDERERGTVEPDERVKHDVMAAFRAQQRPQWRIWLNTVAAWLAPGDAAAMWRPALALGSLALLIVGGVAVTRQFSGASENAMVAELKKAEQHAPAPPADINTDNAAVPVATEETKNDPAAEVDGPAVVNVRVPYAADSGSADGEREATMAYDAGTAAEAESVNEDAAFFAPVVEDARSKPVGTTVSGAAATETLSHVVTANELAGNMSTTNATGRVVLKDVSAAAKSTSKTRAKAEQPRTMASRSVAQDPRVLDLVTAGW
ncbi:MAG: hypothetical protein JNM62_04775 [Flavobacteriales bacterium]|nr:hypothetical protein [Flavobacteriales bacterium]